MGSKSPGNLGFYSTWSPPSCLTARLASVGRRAPRRAFFPLQQPWLPRPRRCVEQFFVVKMWGGFFWKRKSGRKVRGNERHTIFQICYFATNLDVLSWCFRVFYDFCFQFEIDHPPPTPHFCDNSSGFFESSSSWGSTPPKRITFDFQSRRFSEIPWFFGPLKMGGPVCPVTASCHLFPHTIHVWYIYPHLLDLYGKLGRGFKYFSFSSLPEEDYHFDYYFSNGLVQPPTSKCW